MSRVAARAVRSALASTRASSRASSRATRESATATATASGASATHHPRYSHHQRIGGTFASTAVARGPIAPRGSFGAATTFAPNVAGRPAGRARAFASRGRGKESSSAAAAATGNARERNDLAATPEEGGAYDEITDKWIPEKPVSAVEGASYGLVGLAGLGIAAGAVWFGARELLVTPREQRVFDAAMEKLREDVRVSVAVGTPMTGYGSESRSRSARHRIPHRVVIDERGRERVLVQFHVRGSRGSAVVRAEAGMRETTGEWEFQYIIVDVQGAHATRIQVVSPQAAPQRLVAL
jgi:import inner membrane translocase subunit TIM21